LIDLRRLEKIMTQRNRKYNADDGLVLWLGVQDVSLAAENLILAAESHGLGSVLLGAAPSRAEIISEVFNLPDRVFPVVGLCLGYPDTAEETSVRPRFPLKYSAFEDSYKDLNTDEINECMKQMDEGYISQGYYIKMNAKIPLHDETDDNIGYDTYSWSEHISRKLCRGIQEETLISIIKKKGFRL
jgi:hypothetical protein